MKLRTLIPVTFANSINTLTEGIIEGRLIGNSQGFRFDYNSTFSYEYNSLDGFLIKSSSIMFTKEEINTLYESVKTYLPLDLSYIDTTEYLYYLGMKIKMAETFSINIEDIEIITE